jgi:hypothetical protein
MAIGAKPTCANELVKHAHFAAAIVVEIGYAWFPKLLQISKFLLSWWNI